MPFCKKLMDRKKAESFFPLFFAGCRLCRHPEGAVQQPRFNRKKTRRPFRTPCQTVDKIPLGCIEGPQSFDFKSAGPALPVRGAVIPLPLSIFGRKMSVSGHPCPEMPFYRKLMYPSKDCFRWLSMAGCRLCRHPEASP